jgi:superfamily I DNA and/or RNA helicase
MEFPNRLMYEGRLRADASVAHRRLSLGPPPSDATLRRIVDPGHPVVFADTSSGDAGERLPERSTSYENPVEAEWVLSCVEALTDGGVDAASIGIITPYLSQVKRIRKMLDEREIPCEVKSVDGFQGREKEVILISFVRSNLAREIGFVKDRRRLNVAMTRAKTKLIMIGDMETLKANDPFDRLDEWLRREGAIVPLPVEG